MITELIQIYGYQLTNKQIWTKITEELEGEFMYNGNTSFMSAEFGKLSQKQITSRCREIFGGKPSRDMKNRGHIFDEKKLKQLESFYNLSLEVKVKDMTDMTDMTLSGDVGLDKHLHLSNTNEETERNFGDKNE